MFLNQLKRYGLVKLSFGLRSAFALHDTISRAISRAIAREIKLEPKAGIRPDPQFGLLTLLLAFWMILGNAVSAQDNAVSAQDGQSQAQIIVALGDSLTAGYGLAPGDGFVPQMQAALRAKGHHVVVQNAGVSGDTSSGGLARLDWAVGPSTKGVIIALGANDMLRGIAPSITRRNLDTIITHLQARNIDIMLVGMLAAPNLGASYARSFNMIYPQLAQKYGLVFYPFFLEGVAAQRHLNLPDGIHPNREGIAQIVARMTPQVERFIQPLKTRH